MRLEVLGFAGAAPLQGACPSYLLSHGRARVLLDCGPGTLERLWRRGALGELDAIVISHMHLDHVLDLLPLAGDVARALLPKRRPALYVPAGDGPDVLRRLNDVFARSPDQPSRFELAFDIREYAPPQTLSIGELHFSFAATAHQQPCFAARVGGGGTTIVYGADGAPSDALAELARGADLLICESTFVADDKAAAQHGHTTAAQAGQLAARAGAARLLLTHVLAGTPAADLVAAAAQAFAGPIDVAHEGYCFPR